MTCVFRAGIVALAASLMLTLPVGATPTVSPALTRPHVYDGLFGKLFRPKIDLGKTTRALTYPVKKATVNGGKAVVGTAVNGGKAVAGAAASYYIGQKKQDVVKIIPHGK